jgi:hypothetical protein
VIPAVPSADAYASEPVRHSALTIVDIGKEAAAVSEVYRNQVLSQVNGSCLRLGVLEGQYPWHQHPHSDELFLVVEGSLGSSWPMAGPFGSTHGRASWYRRAAFIAPAAWGAR